MIVQDGAATAITAFVAASAVTAATPTIGGVPTVMVLWTVFGAMAGMSKAPKDKLKESMPAWSDGLHVWAQRAVFFVCVVASIAFNAVIAIALTFVIRQKLFPEFRVVDLWSVSTMIAFAIQWVVIPWMAAVSDVGTSRIRSFEKKDPPG